MDDELDPKRLTVAALDLLVGESSATTLALVIHELATNSIKYGALSSPRGVLEISCTERADDLVLVWKETGGPPVIAPHGPTGFGSKLVTQSVSGQLGGSLTVEWRSEGAVITLCANKARLGA
jgi:two-component sensor histidine kinase